MRLGLASAWRLWFVCVAVVASLGCIGTQLVNLHVVQSEKLLSQVERVRKRLDPLDARRGEIQTANGTVLATSRSMFEVGVDPHVARPEDETKLPELARLLEVPQASVLDAFRPRVESGEDGIGMRPVRWVKLAEAIDERTYEQVLALGIKGVYGNRQYRRAYPGNELAAHVVGFVNREGVAAMGVEQYMDYYLRGQGGWRETERDGHRRELAQFRTREVPPTDGYNVVLSIDSFIQLCIETELRQIVRKFDPVGATIIVSDPRDGFILGLANYPNFDLNNFNKADLASQRNRAITDIYEPGSTFKIVSAAAALNEGIVTPQTLFDCSLPTITRFNHTFRLPQDTHEYNELSMAQVVAKSSNRGAAQLGIKLGARRLYEYSAAFGFGERSGFPLGGEVEGMLHRVENWDGLTITRLPIGHAIAATPIQVHYAMSVIANDGVLMRPQVVRRIVDRNGAVVFDFPPVPRRRVIRAETAKLMAQLLTGVVSPEGTAPQAAIPGFEVAAKTGTTQKIIDNRYSSRHHVGSFVGFFPASRPRVAISVIIDDARLNGTAYGSRVAAPSFKNIAEQLIQYLGISPTEPEQNGLNIAGEARLYPNQRDRIR